MIKPERLKLIKERMARNQAILVLEGLYGPKGEAPEILWGPGVLGYPLIFFLPPEQLSMHMKAINAPADNVVLWLIDEAFASLAVHRLFVKEQEDFRTAIDVTKVVRPELKGYKSNKWTFYYNLMAEP